MQKRRAAKISRFLEAAGVAPPVHMQGVNQVPAWEGGPAARQWSITENHHGYTRFHMHSFDTELISEPGTLPLVGLA